MALVKSCVFVSCSSCGYEDILNVVVGPEPDKRRRELHSLNEWFFCLTRLASSPVR
jgi:hypothetical protein